MSLRKALDSLDLQQLALLKYSLENEMSQWVMLDEKRFIGVNVTDFKQLKIEETLGKWSYGVLSE
jgi:hypothetical protein